MGSITDNYGWRYPYLSDQVTRQQLVDLADDVHGTLDVLDSGRVAALRRTSGMWGATASAGTISGAGTPGYLSWNVDHAGAIAAGGTQFTPASQGPSLPVGLYRVDVHALITAYSGTVNSVLVEIERAGTPVGGRPFLPASQPSVRLSLPLRIATAGQQLRVRVTLRGSTPSVTFGRTDGDSSPRLSWCLLAAG